MLGWAECPTLQRLVPPRGEPPARVINRNWSRSGVPMSRRPAARRSRCMSAALIILTAAAVPQARPSLADDEQVDHSGQRHHGSGGTTARRGRQTRSSAARGANGVVPFPSNDGQLRRTRSAEIGATIRNGRQTDEGVANPQ